MLNGPNAAKDFRVRSSKCVIVGVFHHEETTTRHNTATKGTDVFCFDVYTYEFAWCQDGATCSPTAAPSNVGNTTGRGSTPAWSSGATEVEVYRDWFTFFPGGTFVNSGWESTLLVSAGSWLIGSCSGGARSEPLLHAGEWVTCYEPTSQPTNSHYRCGSDNTGCIKVLDPADDLVDLGVALADNMYVGIGFAVFFGLFLLCFCRKAKCNIWDYFTGDDESSKV